MAKQSTSVKGKPSAKKNRRTENPIRKKQTAGKRQPTGYLTFCNEQRTNRKAEFETMKPKDIMQYLGAEWRKLSPQEKEMYKPKASDKSHHEASNKSESKSQKSQTQAKATHDHSDTKRTSDPQQHESCSKSASKRKANTNMIKNAREKSESRKMVAAPPEDANDSAD